MNLYLHGIQNLTVSRYKIITQLRQKLYKHAQRPLLEPISGKGIMLTITQ